MRVDTTRPSLLERLRDSNDDEAWREFERRYADLILYYCRVRGLQHQDAEDVHQKVMVNLSRAFQGGFEYSAQRGRFRAYLGRAVKNEILRLRSRTEIILDPDPGAAVEQDRDEAWEEEWRRHHLKRAIDRFRETAPALRIEFYERLLAGEPLQSIGEGLGLSEAATYKTKQRIVEQLRSFVEVQIRDEEQIL